MKVKFWHFLTPPHLPNSQNSIILYTLLENWTTHIAILNNQKRKTKSLFHVKSIMSVAVVTVKILQYAQHSPPRAKFVLTFEKTRRQSSVTALQGCCNQRGRGDACSPQPLFLAYLLTLLQPGPGTNYAHHITTYVPPRFSDLATALPVVYTRKLRSRANHKLQSLTLFHP